ncbi:transposable element Tc1 transposase [Trichonephila clavipes]|nr:transposable element Tc1 transposase [Trichonephila clavipes]
MSNSKELSEFDRGSIVGYHFCGKSVCEIADILQKPKFTVSDVIVKWKRRGSETAEKRTDRPKILGERSRRTLKRVVKQNRKFSFVEISQEFRSSSGISVSSRTVRRELKNLGFHGHAAAHKPNITSQNAKHRLQWCRVHRDWTVDMGKTVLWSDESRFTVWQSDGRVWVWRMSGRTFLQ